jgi:hypothetical protein
MTALLFDAAVHAIALFSDNAMLSASTISVCVSDESRC